MDERQIEANPAIRESGDLERIIVGQLRSKAGFYISRLSETVLAIGNATDFFIVRGTPEAIVDVERLADDLAQSFESGHQLRTDEGERAFLAAAMAFELMKPKVL